LRSLLIGIAVIGVIALVPASSASSASSHFFPQTGFSVDDPKFIDYFDHRGGVRAFGYPVSREFFFQGFPVQVFQRAVMQRYPDGHVALLNLLDNGLFPYTRVNGATFPGVDGVLVATAPTVGTPGYGQAVLDWLSNNTPDTWNGLPVVFYQSFISTVSAADAFPRGRAAANLLDGFDLEIWGVPTSHPALDPRNSKFVYQRFQRGILHFDQATNTTQGILLADYFKSILMGENLPADVAAQARTSPFFGQYNPLSPGWVDRPAKLAGTDLTRAFEPVAPVIVLDPGHGGPEIGASHNFADGTVLQEKNLNLAVANKTAALLRQYGYKVVQTRTTDRWVDWQMKEIDGDNVVDLRDDLQLRNDIANNAHATLFLSMHFNGYNDPAVRGTTVYYDDARPFAKRSQYFATLLDAEIGAALQRSGINTMDRGVQTDSQAVGYGSHFYVLGPDAVRPTQVPGALVEGMFLTNDQDATALRDPKTIDTLAQAYAQAIRDYYSGG
jgi:N-acetylmuramoyl-L-alanine amidase